MNGKKDVVHRVVGGSADENALGYVSSSRIKYRSLHDRTNRPTLAGARRAPNELSSSAEGCLPCGPLARVQSKPSLLQLSASGSEVSSDVSSLERIRCPEDLSDGIR